MGVRRDQDFFRIEPKAVTPQGVSWSIVKDPALQCEVSQ